MNAEARKMQILTLLACFPSTQGWSADQTKLTTGAFLDQTSSFSLEALSAACKKLGRGGGAFPPSAGDLYAACKEAQRKVDWDRAGGRKLDLSKYRLPPPVKLGFKLAELANWELLINGFGQYVMRVDKDEKPLQIPAGYPGAGQSAVHGYLTPNEAAAVHAARAKKANARKPYAEAAE
jgi:hypothetical protein